MTHTPTHRSNLPGPGAEIDGRYRVVDRIGEGSYGWVFAVEHLLLGQTFAMKILHPRIASEPSWIARFREEAKSTALIGHENIVFVTDFGKCPDWGSYFIMEYLEGRTLEEVLSDGEPLGVQRSVQIAMQAAGALSAAHDQGIVHRDLKPGNIMLVERADGSEACKLLDFGISSIVMAAADTNKLYGTPAYMAPEQAIQSNVDGRADQFSLATIVYQMLTGRAPWETNGWDAQIRPLYTVRFRTAERLIREYRRNMLAGGLFLPTDERPALNSDIELQLTYEPVMRSIARSSACSAGCATSRPARIIWAPSRCCAARSRSPRRSPNFTTNSPCSTPSSAATTRAPSRRCTAPSNSTPPTRLMPARVTGWRSWRGWMSEETPHLDPPLLYASLRAGRGRAPSELSARKAPHKLDQSRPP